MADNKFDAKSFNPQAFKYKADRVPRVRLNEMRKSRVLTGNPDIRAVLGSQDGTAYARIAMRGLLDGEAVNYDGKTDITATSTKTFEQGVVVIGRAKAWVERDFSYDITGGVDFMDNVAAQVANYWEDVDQDTILAILNGVFSMTSKQGKAFVAKHTLEVEGPMQPTTLNTATTKACGDHKKRFSMVFMHSNVATNLENLNLLTALKFTDKDGMTRDLSLYTWGGKLVVVDDGMPAVDGYFPAAEGDPGALKVTTKGGGDKEVKKEDVNKSYFGDGDVQENAFVVPGTLYTTYTLGEGVLSFEDLGAKVPNEMSRDPAKNGGQDTLYTRQRKVFAPFGISYEKKSQASLSPTDAELENGANWDIVHSGEDQEQDRSYIADKAILICRILSRG